MKLPRDIDGAALIRALKPLKTGTLAGILKSLAAHHQVPVADLIRMLDI